MPPHGPAKPWAVRASATARSADRKERWPSPPAIDPANFAPVCEPHLFCHFLGCPVAAGVQGRLASSAMRSSSPRLEVSRTGAGPLER